MWVLNLQNSCLNIRCVKTNKCYLQLKNARSVKLKDCGNFSTENRNSYKEEYTYHTLSDAKEHYHITKH